MSEPTEIEKRMLSGEPFTYGGVCAELHPGQRDMDPGRIVDRTIQKLRRRGLIEFQREHGKVVWSLTDAAAQD